MVKRYSDVGEGLVRLAHGDEAVRVAVLVVRQHDGRVVGRPYSSHALRELCDGGWQMTDWNGAP